MHSTLTFLVNSLLMLFKLTASALSPIKTESSDFETENN